LIIIGSMVTPVTSPAFLIVSRNGFAKGSGALTSAATRRDGAGRHDHIGMFGDRRRGEARRPHRIARGIAIVDDDILALAIAEFLEPGLDPLKRLGIATFHSDMQRDDMRHALLRPGKACCTHERRAKIPPLHRTRQPARTALQFFEAMHSPSLFGRSISRQG
jgi:hypothetical protein